MIGPQKRTLNRKVLLMCVTFGLVGGCASQPAEQAGPPQIILQGSSSVPTVTEAPIPLTAQTPTGVRSSAFYYGTQPALGLTATASSVAPGAYPDASGNGITLNFANANVQDVAKAVLGDLLKLNYEIDPTVQGTITLTTASPVDRDAVLPIFEQSLMLAGLALVQQDTLYRIVPAADAPRQAGTPIVAEYGETVSPGFGLEIIPLRYVSAPQMQTLLQPMVPAGSIISADTTRNILTIAGTANQRSAILNDVALFDVDQMAGKSFALFRPQWVNADGLARGLQAIIAGPSGAGLAGVLKLIPLDRLNAVLAITTQPAYLSELQSWVIRLDQPSDSNNQQLYVYQVQNGKAADLAAVLNNAFEPAGASPQNTNTPNASLDSDNDNTDQSTLSSGPGPSTSSPPMTPTPVTSSLPSTDQSDLSGASALLGNDVGQSLNGGAAGSAASGSGPPLIGVTADEVNNALVIRCLPSQYTEIQEALRELDIPPLQVLIEASVAEVTLSSQLQYGVQYYFQGGSVQAIQTTSMTKTVVPALPGFAAIFQEGQSIPIILSALQSLTKVNVLSAPDLMVLNNQTATLQVGDEVPIATQQSQSTLTNNAPIINSIEYENTGVILKVTPRVNADGLVTMDVSQEVSDVSTTTTSTLNSPTISERLISSSVAIHDGQTVALGGLISDTRTNGKSGVPFLQNIPYLGNLFSTTNHQLARTELLVLLTPHVVGSEDQAQEITAELRNKLIGTLPSLAVGQ
jgi:general secretion pathway protein D